MGLLRLGDAATGRTQPSHATRAATGGGGVERSGWSAATHSLLKQRQRAIMAPPADMAVVYPSFELQRVHSQPAGHGSQDKQGKGGAGGTITIRAVAGPAGRRRARSFSLISADTTELADRPARSLGGAGAGAATAAQAAGERAPAAPAKAAAAAAPRAAEGPVSAEHLAMLDGLRAQWQVPKGAPLWRKLQAGLEWRVWWVGHAMGLFCMDTDEAALMVAVYLVIVGLLAYEVCRRCGSAAHALF